MPFFGQAVNAGAVVLVREVQAVHLRKSIHDDRGSPGAPGPVLTITTVHSQERKWSENGGHSQTWPSR